MAAPGNRRNYFYFASPLHPSPFPPPSFPPISLKKSWGNYVREILLNNQQTLPFPSRHPSKHSSHSLPLNSVEFCRAKWALYTSYTCTCGELKFRSHTSLNWFICLNFHYLNHFQRFFITCLFHHRLIVIFLSHLSSQSLTHLQGSAFWVLLHSNLSFLVSCSLDLQITAAIDGPGWSIRPMCQISRLMIKWAGLRSIFSSILEMVGSYLTSNQLINS